MKRLIKIILPPPQWQPAVIVLLGILAGVLMLIIHASEAHSYISNKPETCINCHVMYPQYASWSRSSHHEAANCADCHVPHDNLFRKYYFKGKDGMRHATIFTARTEPQTIEIKPAGINVVQENCIRCHRELVETSSIIEITGRSHAAGEGHRCWDCHRDVPHGTVRSLSSAPHSLVPRLPALTPRLFDKIIPFKVDDDNNSDNNENDIKEN